MSSSPNIGHDDSEQDPVPPQSPHMVDGQGPDEISSPVNWGSRKKIVTVGIVSLFNFLTPLGSAMFAPGVSQAMEEFGSTSKPMSSFVVSVYLLGFAFGPLVVAPLSELYGRLPIYHASNVLFALFNVACALAPSLSSLVGFRFLAGSAGSAPLALGAGTIADIIAPHRRGLAISAWAVGPVIGPVVGPVCGGFLSQDASWRWVFWTIAIASGVVTGISFLVLRETYAPALEARRAKHLRGQQKGDTYLRSASSNDSRALSLFAASIVLPLKLLIFSPIVFLLSLYVALVYGFLYLLFTTMSQVYHDQYHFSTSIVGLTYIGLGVGSALGLLATGRLSDPISHRLAARARGSKKPEYRLAPMIPLSLCLPIGLFWYGWSTQQKVHWIVPIIGTGWIGVGVVVSFTSIQTYLVEAFTTSAASAAAANTVLRSLMGAVLPLAGPSMYSALGLGWGNSLLAFIAISILPLPIVFFMYGETLRTRYPMKA
ncbi:MFS general substrate transporter [Aspergillus avenaceus]|uniref:MFS general substrate transporter n=1 Tax=Aspergillus avenaceus TaxID=36643 RepID=A0A5N6U1R1_ASPAV|nr:MFS general substrate transporter [Aspergillus avenaceus]